MSDCLMNIPSYFKTVWFSLTPSYHSGLVPYYQVRYHLLDVYRDSLCTTSLSRGSVVATGRGAMPDIPIVDTCQHFVSRSPAFVRI